MITVIVLEKNSYPNTCITENTPHTHTLTHSTTPLCEAIVSPLLTMAKLIAH